MIDPAFAAIALGGARPSGRPGHAQISKPQVKEPSIALHAALE